MANFIKAALDKVLTEGNQFPSVTYETPPAGVKYMEMQSALGNPPWKKREKVKQNNMKINENEIWNDELIIHGGKYGEELKIVNKHKVYKHNIIWYDPKTTTVADAYYLSKSEDLQRDMVDLMLLIKHESEDENTLQFATGIYIERDNIPEPIYEFRYCDETKNYMYAPPEGEIIAFSLVWDLPLMMKFNENE